MKLNEIEKIGDFPFEVDARVAIQLGRESISSSLVAMLELVKNAYDADAEKVTIDFSSRMLTVTDNGSGMTKEQIIKNWLRISTNNKVVNQTSRGKGRILIGAKGLGRLGIDRLCEELCLETKNANSEIVYRLIIKWPKYEGIHEESLSNIKHELFKIPLSLTNFIKESHGTVLKMVKLKDNWYHNDLEMIRTLRKELMLLISPFVGINDFKIELLSGKNNPDIDGEIQSDEFLKAAEWVVKSNISKTNKVTVIMSSPIYGGVKYERKEIPWKEWINDRVDIPRCGPLSFDFYFYLTSKKKEEFSKIDFKKEDVQEFITNNSGIRIYRDEFRVKPYGNPNGEGDWLTLQNRKAKEPAGIKRSTWVVGLHQIMGAVFISRKKNKLLIDQTNREGIVEEDAFFDLRAFALKNIQWFESNRHDFENTRSDDTSKDIIKKEVDDLNFEVRKELGEIKILLENDDIKVKPIKQKLVNLEDKINKKEKATEQYEELLEEELNILANLASLGILTVSFGHESLEQSNFALNAARELKSNYEKGTIELLSPYNKEFGKDLETILSSTDFISTFAKFALGNVRIDKRKQKNISLKNIINNVFKAMGKTLSNKNVDVDIKGIKKSSLLIRGFPIDWESIFINLITNSIYALKAIVDGKRLINVSIHEESDSIRLIFCDSGIGLETGTEESIFLPNFSTKRDRMGNVIGTGMGLAIVKTFVEDHSNGAIKAISRGQYGGAEFHITIPVVKREIR